MNRETRVAVRLMLFCVFVIIFTASGFAAEIRRVPGYDRVEQGLMALTLDVEGAENFRYTGLESNMHIYRGKIKPGNKLKFVIKATLVGAKTLPITGRNCTVRMEIIAKKGGEVIKNQNFKSDNKRNLFLNYTMPEDADAIEVSETFVLNNKSANKEYNKQITERNKVILTTTDSPAVVAVAKKGAGNNGSGSTGESKGSSTGMMAGIAVIVAAVGAGGFFFMKKKKEKQAAADAEQKEALRQQEMIWQLEIKKRQEELQRQQELQKQEGMYRQQKEQMHGKQVAQTQTALQYEPKFCSNCGAKLEPGSVFCGNCGAKV